MNNLPILGIVAAGNNAGKTTLITELIPELAKRGIRISVIKHPRHKFDIDHPVKDSYNIRETGAIQTLIASDGAIASSKPQLALNNTEVICEFIFQWVQSFHQTTS